MPSQQQVAAEIVANIYANFQQKITGPILQQVLLDMISLPNVGTLTVSQIRQGLGDPTSLAYDPNNLVTGNIPPDIPYDAIAVGWASAYIPTNSALYNFIQTTLNLSPAIMQQFYQNCFLYPVAP